VLDRPPPDGKTYYSVTRGDHAHRSQGRRPRFIRTPSAGCGSNL